MKEYQYIINGNHFSVSINKLNSYNAEVEVNGKLYNVSIPVSEKDTIVPANPVERQVSSPKSATAVQGTPKPIKSPLPGSIISIDCKIGDVVKEGQKILVLEAMKMENSILAERDGTVTEILVHKGDTVLEGADLLIIS
jgi:biotin carboxyl carrier protein